MTQVKLLINAPEYINEVAKVCYNEWIKENHKMGIYSENIYAMDLRDNFMNGTGYPVRYRCK